jgi:hypothetical protein
VHEPFFLRHKEWRTRETDNISNSSRLGIGSDEFFCLSISWDDGEGEGAGNAMERKAAVSFRGLLHHDWQQNAMAVPYTTACKWVRIWSSISAVAFDVENGEKRCNNNKEKCIGQVPPGTDPFSKSKYGRQRWIITQASVRVDKSFGFEWIWFWEPDWIVKDRPNNNWELRGKE